MTLVAYSPGVLPPDFARYDTIGDTYRALSSSPSVPPPHASQDLEPSQLESQPPPPSPKRKHHGLARHFQRLSGAPPSSVADERTPFLRTREPSEWMDAVRPFNSSGGVSLPLPLVIAHDLSRSLFTFRRQGALEAIGMSPSVSRGHLTEAKLTDPLPLSSTVVGPAGLNAMQGMIQTMIDQMGAMERVRWLGLFTSLERC